MEFKNVKNHKNFKNAFTLAEVLVTLGVIGVLFALIIPFITSAYKKNLVSHRLQKFYNIFKI